MSIGSENYFETYKPDKDILKFWHKKWHCEATNKSNISAKRTREITLDCIARFERFLASRTDIYQCHWTDIDIADISYENLSPHPRSVTPRVAEQFLIELQDNYAPKTQDKTYRVLYQAYNWCENKIEFVEINPFELVKEKHKLERNDWILDSPTGRNPHIVPLREARDIVTAWDNLTMTTIQLIYAKYPRRAGGISNLDFKDVHLNHPACDWKVHEKIRRWPDHIIFRPDKSESEPGRNTGNKTETFAKYPIDDELNDFLLAYLTIRPQPSSPDDPLFIAPKGGRMSGQNMSMRFINHAKDLGYFYGKDHDDNLNPHYWRHWGTSWYQDQLGGNVDANNKLPLVDYLRGDKRPEIKAIYDNYTEEKRDHILNAMPIFHERYITE